MTGIDITNCFAIVLLLKFNIYGVVSDGWLLKFSLPRLW